MHDVGYLMTDDEAVGTGAQFTTSHVSRGIEFTKKHLSELPSSLLEATVKVIQVTDHRQHPDWVTFDNPQQELAAFATATSDLIGQMANREYIERLLFLYFEFEEAKLGGFADVHDFRDRHLHPERQFVLGNPSHRFGMAHLGGLQLVQVAHRIQAHPAQVAVHSLRVADVEHRIAL